MNGKDKYVVQVECDHLAVLIAAFATCNLGCVRSFQWARIVLVVERGVSPAERLKKLMDYSQPMSGNRRALVLRLNQSVCLKIIIYTYTDVHMYTYNNK